MAEEIASVRDNRLSADVIDNEASSQDGELFIEFIDEPTLIATPFFASFTSGGGGVTLFLELTDTPNSYTGQAGFSAVVNPGETALIFTRMEPYLGNPAADGYVLSSTVAGVRSWIPPGGAGTVASVFGRTGAVIAENGDYDADQIDDAATTNKFATQAELDQIGTNQTDITAVTATADQNVLDIADNVTDIANNTSNISANAVAIATKEDDLGLPALDGYVLSSTALGVRSWIPAPGGSVDSVFGRTGAVIAESGDYDADQIDDAATTNKFATQAELDQIATNAADIATNVTNIATNTADIATNVTNIATNTADIATNVTNIATNAADIATNVTNIATNAADIATNTADIATNVTNIATNVTDIATNVTNIATNTADIATNTADIATNTADIGNNTADIATNTADIATNVTNIATNTADIATNAAAIPKNYIANPDAAIDTSDSTDTANVTMARTTTAAQLPEGNSKNTAWAVTASGAATDGTDYAQFDAKWSWDEADTNVGSGTIRCIATGGWKLVSYNVTDGLVLSESDEITSTMIKQVDVYGLADKTIVLRLVPTTANPPPIYASGVKIEPATTVFSPVITDWEPYTPVYQGFSSVATRLQYRQNGDSIQIKGDLTPGSTSAVIARIGLPNNWQIKLLNSTGTVLAGRYEADTSVTNCIVGNVLATNGDTFFTMARGIDGIVVNPLTPANASTLVGPGTRFTIEATIPVAGLQGTSMTMSEAQQQNAIIKYSNVATVALSTTSVTPTVVKYLTQDSDITLGEGLSYDVSTGAITANFTGPITVKAQVLSVAASGSTVLAIGTDTTSNFIVQNLATNSSTGVSPSIGVDLNIGPSTTYYVKCYSTSAANLTANANYNILSVTRISQKTGTAVGLPIDDNATTTPQKLVPTIYKSNGEGTLGDITNPITNWATVDSGKYRWYVIGKICFYEHRCESATGSVSTTGWYYDLPGDVPPPSYFSSQSNSEFVLPAATTLATATSATPSRESLGAIYDNGGTLQVYGYVNVSQSTKLWTLSAFWKID